MTLTEFLLARIAEDEAKARAAAAKYAEDGSAPAWSRRHWERRLHAGPTATFVMAHSPARVLAECEAKRGIVEECQMLIESFGDWDATPGAPIIWLGVGRRERSQAHGRLRALASVYADHPDCHDEWKP